MELIPTAPNSESISPSDSSHAASYINFEIIRERPSQQQKALGTGHSDYYRRLKERL